jgi:threonine dehydrogenase-like Zn-dependent dehydrogenase
VEQLVLNAPGLAEWTEVPAPTLAGGASVGAPAVAGDGVGGAGSPEGAALVRPLAVATCDLDTAINSGAFPLPLPYALGHEFVAEVVEVGPSVTTVRTGDRVAVPFQINCGTCTACRRGLTQSCTTVPRGSAYGLGAIGRGDWGGAVADLVRVPFADAMLLPLPSGVDPATVASLDNLPDGWRTVAPYLDEFDDKRVLVVGGISIGLYAVAVARALGADVTYVDGHPRRIEVAAKLGATVLDPAEGKVGRFPVTVSTSGTRDGLLLALGATEPGGVCTDTGVFIGDVALPLGQMYTTGVRFVTGRVAARHELPAVLELVASGRLDPSVVTATTAKWSDAPAAWSGHRDKLVLIR